MRVCRQKTDWPQFLVGTFASLGSLTFGYDLGVIAQVIASPSFKNNIGEDPAEMFVCPMPPSQLVTNSHTLAVLLYR